MRITHDFAQVFWTALFSIREIFFVFRQAGRIKGCEQKAGACGKTKGQEDRSTWKQVGMSFKKNLLQKQLYFFFF